MKRTKAQARSRDYDIIGAIIDRYNGIPYSVALERNGVKPTVFYMRATRDLDNLIALNESGDSRTLEILVTIRDDKNLMRELFKMDEKFIEEQYLRVMGKTPGKKQMILFQGTLKHPENAEKLIYIALTTDRPMLKIGNRGDVINGVKNMPVNLGDYFYSLGLRGLMNTSFKKEEKNSPLAVLKVFDKVYQEKTGDASLFDLKQEKHLHEWGDMFIASKHYWRKQVNVEKAIYHTLIEASPALASSNREEVINGVKNMPVNLGDYFHSVGLTELMRNLAKMGWKNSPLAVLKVFDKLYQEKTGDASLFDLKQEKHLHEWGDMFDAPKHYWRKQVNVEKAIYHTLIEASPALASSNREEVINGIKNMPIDRIKYLGSLGLRGLMRNAFVEEGQDSPLAVLKVFDKVYQEKTMDESLFDTTQKIYLRIYGKNRIKN